MTVLQICCLKFITDCSRL